MGKRILIGSLLVLTLLLLMPSIPAIQQKTVEDNAFNELKEKLESIRLEDLNDIDLLDGIKHPLLYIIVLLKFNIRNFRFALNFFFAMIAFAKLDPDDPFGIEVTNPILFWILMVRAFWFYVTGNAWLVFYAISDKLGWGWKF